MLGDVRNPIGATLADDQPEQPTSLRGRSDGGPVLAADAARDEPFDAAMAIRDPESGVLRINQDADAVHDELEDPIQVQLACDGPGRHLERVDGRLQGGIVSRRKVRFVEQVVTRHGVSLSALPAAGPPAHGNGPGVTSEAGCRSPTCTHA